MRLRVCHLVKHIILSMYLDVGGVDCWTHLLCLNQFVPFSQEKSLIKHGEFFLILPYFNSWFTKFHENCRVLSNVLWGSTSRFKVESWPKILEEGDIGCYWWMGSQYTINSSLLHNCMLDLKSSNNVIPSWIMKK